MGRGSGSFTVSELKSSSRPCTTNTRCLSSLSVVMSDENAESQKGHSNFVVGFPADIVNVGAHFVNLVTYDREKSLLNLNGAKAVSSSRLSRCRPSPTPYDSRIQLANLASSSSNTLTRNGERRGFAGRVRRDRGVGFEWLWQCLDTRQGCPLLASHLRIFYLS